VERNRGGGGTFGGILTLTIEPDDNKHDINFFSFSGVIFTGLINANCIENSEMDG
jgi:hypothetical protein